MASLIVVYPAAGTRFDRDYYAGTHGRLVHAAWDKAGLESLTWVFGEAALGGGAAPFHCIATLTFADRATLEAAAANPDAAGVFGDIPNFTDSTPVAMIA